MQITVTIPDDFAAQIRARGVTPERYVETLIAEQTRTTTLPADKETRLADLESFFKEMAAHSNKVPILPDEAFTRESFYPDYD